LLMVARPGHLNTSAANAARESIDRSGQDVIGMVVNAVIPENEGDSYYYYSYAKEYYHTQEFTSSHRRKTEIVSLD
jgi:polysaccharide biosynthesis transport protein